MRYPLVLIPGTSFTQQRMPRHYFYGVEREITRRGREACFVNLPVFRTIEDRAVALRKAVRERFGSQPVHLVAHSAGGLDARYFISRLGGDSQVISLTTLATPHRGSYLIRFWQDVLPRKAIGAIKWRCERGGGSIETFLELGPEFTQGVFNPSCPDSPRVRYRSITGRISPGRLFRGFPLFWLTGQILNKYEGENDGFVSVKSARWGDVIAQVEADHYQMVGHPFGITRSFSHLDLYRNLIEELA